MHIIKKSNLFLKIFLKCEIGPHGLFVYIELKRLQTAQIPWYFLHHLLVVFHVSQVRNSNLRIPVTFNFVDPSNFYHRYSHNES